MYYLCNRKQRDMNREQAIKTLKTICSQVAEKYGFTEMEIGQDRQKGIWGEKFTEFLEKTTGGDCSTEIKWRKPGNDYDRVEFRFRFDNPVISIRFRDKEQRETLANLEFATKRYVPDGVWEEDEPGGWHKKGDTKYNKIDVPCELTEVMMWNPKVAGPHLKEMEEMWDEMQ